MTIERRSFKLDELRATENGKITGHAAVFNAMSEEMFGFREQIKPGAFARAIKEKQDVRALWNHDSNHVLGRTKSGTLQLREDERGLLVDIDFPDTQMARDLRESIKRGDVDQMSFSFRTVKDSWEYRQDGTIIRTLEDVDLFDVSPVTYPAYPDTDVSARSIPDEVKAKVAELRSANPSGETQDPEGAAPTGTEPAWEGTQERLDLMKRRVELAQKS